MSARWWTLVVWALAAAGALYWGLKLFVKAPAAPAHTQVAVAAPTAAGDLTRLLGADPPPEVVAAAPEAPAEARFQLVGVVSPRSTQAAREGVALIAVDGKPAKAYRIGAPVDGETVLQSVGARTATLGPRGGAPQVALNIAPPPAAATGTLPPVDGGFVPNAPNMPPRPPGVVAPQRLPQVVPQPGMAQGPQNIRRVSPPSQAQETESTPHMPSDTAPTR